MSTRLTRKASYVVLGLLGLLGLVLATPAIVWAHAELTKSEPAAHARLATIPTEIRMWFSEEPSVAMTHVVLKNAAGVAVALGQPVKGATELIVRVPIAGAVTPGDYSVEWRTVAADDGHPSNGTFAFTVLPNAVIAPGATLPAASATPTPAVDTSAMIGAGAGDAEAPAYVLARALGFGALIVVIGVVGFQVAVLPRVEGAADVLRDIERGTASLGSWAAGLVIASAFGRLVSQSRVVNGAAALEWHSLRVVATSPGWGEAWHIQVGCAIIALVAFLFARGGRRGAWIVATLAAIVLGFTPAFGGHAAAEREMTWLSIGADGVHVLAASTWLGGLTCVVLVAIPLALRGRDDGGGWAAIAAVVRAFSPVALWAALILLVTGTVSACFRLDHVSALWTSGYGQTLLVKLALVAATAVVATVNWRVLRPRLGTADATQSLSRSASIELMLGVFVVAVTAVLVAMRTP